MADRIEDNLKGLAPHDKDGCPLPHCTECGNHIDIDDSTHIHPWSAYEHYHCSIAKRELARSGEVERTDAGFTPKRDLKSNLGERLTTPELEPESWGDPSEWEDD